MKTAIKTTVSITVKTSELQRALAFVAPFADKGSTLPICQTALLESNASILTLTATNLEIFGRIGIAGINCNPGSFSAAVPAARFARYIELVTDDVIELSTDKARGIQVRHGASALASFSGMSAENFPEMPRLPDDSAQVTIEGLRDALPRCLTSLSEDESRFTLNGALLEIEGTEAKLVSTDGHRISVIGPLAVSPSAQKTRGLLHRSAIQHLSRAEVDQVVMSENETYLFFSLLDGRSVIARKLTGDFPDYQRVMGPLPHSGIIPDAATLLAVLRRVGQLADSRSRSVHFSLGTDLLGLRAEPSETGVASDELPIRWTGPTINFGLNARYLKHFLELVSGEVGLRAEGPERAFEFSVSGWIYRVMPMRM